MGLKLETFKEVLRKSQADLKLTCLKYLINKGYEIQFGDGYVYGKGDIPVMLVAHLDTVHKASPYHIYYDTEQDVMWSPQGIGGDDRCGVYAIYEILKTHKPYVLFLEDEEIGSVGAGKAVKKIEEPNVNFLIELDRRGINDCVFYDCGNEEFKKYIEGFGFETKVGTFTDIVTLSDEWEIASVNLSVGYFNEHTEKETIHLRILESTIGKVKNILDDVKENPKFYEYEKVTSVWKGYDNYYVRKWHYDSKTKEWYIENENGELELYKSDKKEVE